jgi:hypothetical protein
MRRYDIERHNGMPYNGYIFQIKASLFRLSRFSYSPLLFPALLVHRTISVSDYLNVKINPLGDPVY